MTELTMNPLTDARDKLSQVRARVSFLSCTVSGNPDVSNLGDVPDMGLYLIFRDIDDAIEGVEAILEQVQKRQLKIEQETELGLRTVN